jgi:hypothetical protein
VSGDYSFQQADLGVFRGIAGLLSSSGKFSGVLDRIEVQGLTDTPRFTVASSSHQVQLRTQFQAVVNGENGDTFLQKVAATFWKTTVCSEGSVAGKAGQSGKTASVTLAAKDGRIQDILLLFARSERAPSRTAFVFSLCRAARDRRDRSQGFQLLQLGQYFLPIILVLSRINRSREVRIKVENVGESGLLSFGLPLTDDASTAYLLVPNLWLADARAS